MQCNREQVERLRNRHSTEVPMDEEGGNPSDALRG